jgi:hypothetical protein
MSNYFKIKSENAITIIPFNNVIAVMYKEGKLFLDIPGSIVLREIKEEPKQQYENYMKWLKYMQPYMKNDYIYSKHTNTFFPNLNKLPDFKPIGVENDDNDSN